MSAGKRINQGHHHNIMLDLLSLIWGYGESYTIVQWITSQPASAS